MAEHTLTPASNETSAISVSAGQNANVFVERGTVRPTLGASAIYAEFTPSAATVAKTIRLENDGGTIELGVAGSLVVGVRANAFIGAQAKINVELV